MLNKIKLVAFFCFAFYSLNLNSVAKPQDLSNQQYIFPNSHLEKLTRNNFQNLGYRQPTLETLGIARNEIFARKGYLFDSKELSEYFNRKKWYSPIYDNESIKLNEIEEYNISYIKYFEYNMKRRDIYPKTTKPIIIHKNETISVDLDGNGIKDSIYFHTDNTKYQLTINNFTINDFGESIIDSFAVVDIDNRDNVREIVIGELGPSDDPQSTFFCYDGSSINKMGKTYSLFYRGIKFDGWGGLNIKTRGDLLHTWFFNIPYRLTSDHTLEKITDQIYKTNCCLFLKQSLKIFTKMDEQSDFITLEPTTIVTITGTDNNRWCFVKTFDGIEGWFFVQDYFYINGTGIEAYNIFDGLSYAD